MTLVVSPGLAQTAGADNDAAAAEALFDAGKQLMAEKKYIEAAEKFRGSQKLDPGIGTLLYLADALEKGEHLASAWATFRSAASLADQAGQKERADVARQRSQELHGKLSTITVNVPPAAKVAGLQVKRGNSLLNANVFGTAVPIDGGNYVIHADAPDHKPWSKTVEIKNQNDAVNVDIPQLEKAPEEEKPESEATPAASTTTSNDGDGTLYRGLGYGLGGLGLVGLGLGGYFLGDAFSSNSKADDLCDDTSCSSQEGQDLSAQAVTSSQVATASFAIGGAALATGIVLLILAPSDESIAEEEATTAKMSITPLVGQQELGLFVGGQW